MNILFFSDNFPPEINAPANRTYEHCKKWVQLGAKVTVITCAPNFPKGKLYKGYKNRLWNKEYVDGIRVIRVWTFISQNSGVLLRMLDHLSFMFSSSLAGLFIKKIDLIITTSPQFFSNFPGLILSKLKKLPWILELRDIWPESIKAVGAIKNSYVISLLEKIELYLYREAQKIIVVTSAFKQNLISRGIDEAKINIITNGASIKNFDPDHNSQNLKESMSLNRKFCIGYIGTIGMAHKLDILLNLAKKIESSKYCNDFHILMIGDGSEKRKLEKRINNESIKNITLLEPVSRDDLVQYFSMLDTFVIHLKDNDLFKTVIPSKLFEALAMGKPILHGVYGESKEIVEKNNVGLFFKPEDVDDLYKNLLKIFSEKDLYKNFSENCIKASKLYDRDLLAKKMFKILQDEKLKYEENKI